MDGSRLSLFEVDSFVRSLDRLPLSSVGSDAWLAQHDRLEKLNLQAHLDAQSQQHDEYVVDQICSQEKIEVLIHELLVIETWKEKVFPLLLDSFTNITSLKAYMVLYHEATLCNLLEVLLYHASVCEVGGDAMLEMGDYCVRKINQLNAGVFKKIQEDKVDDPKAGLNRTPQETLRQQSLDIGFSVAVCAVSLLRFLSDHVNVLPLGVTSRLLHTHDVLLSLVPLVENPPWTRRRGGQLQKFSDQRWLTISSQDALLMTKLEGQVWLAIYNLLMDNNCRKQYQFNTHRKEVIVRLRRYLTDLMLDQLPLLRELKRLVEELSIMEPPPPTASAMAIIEQIPEIREGIIQGANWKQIAEKQKTTVFANDEAARQREMARLAATYNLSALEDALPPPNCGACGRTGEGMKRCSRCKNEWYCGRACQVKDWKKHQKMCDLLAKDAKTTTNKSSSATAAKPAAATTAASTKPTAATATAAPASASSTSAASSAPSAKPSSSSSSAAASSSVRSPPAAAPQPTAPSSTPPTQPNAPKKPLIEIIGSDDDANLEEPD